MVLSIGGFVWDLEDVLDTVTGVLFQNKSVANLNYAVNCKHNSHAKNWGSNSQ